MERGVENREKLREEREKRSCCVTRCGPDMERLWPPSPTPRCMERVQASSSCSLPARGTQGGAGTADLMVGLLVGALTGEQEGDLGDGVGMPRAGSLEKLAPLGSGMPGG